MKLLIAATTLFIIGGASATLPPGYEDQIWCPKNTCEIYANPYGWDGAPDSSFYFCYNPSSGKTRKGIWTGSLTKTVPPANAIKPAMCTSKQYTQCEIDDDCTLEISPDNAEIPCTCYASSRLHPFVPKVTSAGGNAKCSASVCDVRRVMCDAGTCQLDFTTGTRTTNTSSPVPTPYNTPTVSLAEYLSFEFDEDEDVEGEDEFDEFVDQPASGNGLQCTWKPSFEKRSNHKQACKSLNNGYTVPYTCDGEYRNICCTVSSIVKPTFDRFGTCYMNGAANPVPAPAPTPAATPTSPTAGGDSLKCQWMSTFDKAENHKRACERFSPSYPVPYTCDGEYTNICCTVSGITNPTFSDDKFGTCLKNGTTRKPTEYVAVE